MNYDKIALDLWSRVARNPLKEESEPQIEAIREALGDAYELGRLEGIEEQERNEADAYSRRRG